MTRTAATGIGFTAVLMWSVLALLSASTGSIPPFQLTAMTFLLGGLVGAARVVVDPSLLKTFRQPWRVWLLGVGGIFGYHFVYFAAIRAAPAIEVSLLAYLWPLFIVVFSTFLPGEKLKLHHILGVLAGLAGAALVIMGGNATGLLAGMTYGHVLAFACAFIWAVYSVLSRRFANVPTDMVTAYCLATSLLALLCHLVLETTVWPVGWTQWLALVTLGIFPLGFGFYAWDIGVKRGDIMVLGASSYAAPLLSALVLIGSGLAEFTWNVGAACLLITGGALLAAKDMLFKRAS